MLAHSYERHPKHMWNGPRNSAILMLLSERHLYLQILIYVSIFAHECRTETVRRDDEHFK